MTWNARMSSRTSNTKPSHPRIASNIPIYDSCLMSQGDLFVGSPTIHSATHSAVGTRRPRRIGQQGDREAWAFQPEFSHRKLAPRISRSQFAGMSVLAPAARLSSRKGSARRLLFPLFPAHLLHRQKWSPECKNIKRKVSTSQVSFIRNCNLQGRFHESSLDKYLWRTIL